MSRVLTQNVICEQLNYRKICMANKTSNKLNKERAKFSVNEPLVYEKIEDVESIPKGDMPGDKIQIDANHIEKAQLIFPTLLEHLIPMLDEHPYQRIVISVCGGSGVGKSETASLLSYYLNQMNVGCYILSGDNYPRRIPKYNDAERLRVYRNAGIKGLIASGEYSEDKKEILRQLQESANDTSLDYAKDFTWLATYQQAGRHELKEYLGSSREINFDELNSIVSQFKNGSDYIHIKRMGRTDSELWYDLIDFSDKNVMIVEWTHGNNNNLLGVDIPIFLNSTPKETLEHRRRRSRDGEVDSTFTQTVLAIEQELLHSQASKAKIILTKKGEILEYSEYLAITNQIDI